MRLIRSLATQTGYRVEFSIEVMFRPRPQDSSLKSYFKSMWNRISKGFGSEKEFCVVKKPRKVLSWQEFPSW